MEWIDWVKASEHHQSIDLNVFDILDVGRPALPYTPDSMYPMWGASPIGSPARTASGLARGRFSLSTQVDKINAIREEPRQSGQGKAEGDNRPLIFTHGPVAKQDPAHLYQRAFTQAKRRLGALGHRGVWDVVYVPNREKWVS